MEVTQLGVRTRARAMAMVAEETEDNLVAVKRRKLNNENLRSHSSTFEQVNTHDCEVKVNSVLEMEPSGSTSLRSSGAQASCCSSTGSMEKVSDLKDSFETGTAARYDLDGSEINDYLVCSFITPTSDFKEESGELDATTAKQSSVIVNSGRTLLQAEKMIPEAELEEFFAAAQEDLIKRFKDRYNFDIVNDIPVKGRFEWIQLNPGK